MADSRVMELKGTTIAITGATGFLGRHIVDVLLARGAHVVGVARRPDRVPELLERGVEMRKADLADPDALARGFEGADAVVSNAALLQLTNRDWEAHLQTNVQGTQNVMAAVAAAGCERVVHVSSIAVYKGRSGQVGLCEDHPKLLRSDRGWFNSYPVSKAVSEAEAWRAAKERGLALTCVRPSAIYGKHDQNFTRVLKRLAGLPISVMPLAMTIPLVYAGDVAEAIARCLERPVSIGKSYNTSTSVSARTLLDAWAEATGARPWLRLPVPVPYRQVVDSSLAMEDLNWSPIALEAGLRITAS
jgi:nucleoside-diphosphate-sugar epimerase